MGRRRFVRTMSALGVSGVTINYLTQDTLAKVTDDPENEMPYTAYLRVIKKEPGKPPVREPVHRTIPREEWERRHCTIDARQKIGNLLEEFTSTNLVRPAYAAVPESHIGFGVEVLYQSVKSSDGTIRSPEKSIEEVRNFLPNTIDGEVGEGDYKSRRDHIPVIVKETPTRDLSFDSSVPGGVWTEDGDSEESGTICGTFHDNSDGGDGWITAGHVVGSSGTVEHPDNDDIGTVKDYYNDGIDIDCAFFDADFTETPWSAIASGPFSSSVDLEIGGIVTDSQLNNHVDDSNYTLYTQGIATDRTSGTIEKMLFNDAAVVTTHDTESGDSGGPLFRVIPDSEDMDDAYIAGDVIKEIGSGDANTKSTTADTVENKLGGSFY